MATSSKVPRGARRPAAVAMDGPVPVRLDQLDRDRVDEPLVRKRPASSSELRVGILLWPGFPLLSLAGLCDGLRHAADIGDQSRQVRCSCGFTEVGKRPISLTRRSAWVQLFSLTCPRNNFPFESNAVYTNVLISAPLSVLLVVAKY